MLKIPYAKQQESQIKIAESQITNIDKNIIKILQLFSITGLLDMEIENIRLELAENQHFYPEALFSYLKQYKFQNQQPTNNETPNFFDFSVTQNVNQSIQQQSPLIINAINSAKDGLIPFDNLIQFLQHHLKYQVSVETLKVLERTFHVNQFAYKQNQVIDTNNNQYPLPKDVPPILPNNQQNMTQGSTKVPLMHQANSEVVNSGEGFNYLTFQKMIISQSIPLAKQKVSKRKLIYETNQLQNIDKVVLNLFGKLLQNEIDLLIKSEQIRVQINTDSQYNHIAMFNLLDAHGNGVIEFSFIEQLMTKAQIPFKPQHFKALARRSHMLSHNTTLSESLSFEEYKLLASVQCPYFKIPKSPDDTTISNVEYSRILGTEVSGYNSQQLSISRIPDRLQKNSQLYRSKPTIPLYHSCNPYINETLKKQSKTSERNQQSENFQNDYIVYGTKREWEDLQHSLNVGVESQSLKQQISRIQHSQISLNKVRADSNSKEPQFERSQIQKIQQQALEEDQDRKKDELLSKQLQQAMNANTRGYYSNVVKIENERKTREDANFFVVQAPWYQNDQQVKNKIDVIRKQQDQIQQLSGVNHQSKPPLPNTSPRVPSPLHSQIFQTQKPSQLIQNKQKIMDYKYQIPERQYDYQN